MGRTRLGRFAAVTVPATAVSVGLGFAMLQGMAGMALASASAMEIAAISATGSGLEVTPNYTQKATADNNATPTNKEDVLVSLNNGVLTGLCLAANTQVPGLGQNVGIRIAAAPTDVVSLGAGYTDLAAELVGANQAVLGETRAGYAQEELTNQNAGASNPGFAAGGFSLASDEAVTLTGLNADVYATTLAGLTLNNLSIAGTLTTATCAGYN